MGRQLSPTRRAPGVHSAQLVSRAASKPGTMQGASAVSAHPACLLLGQWVYESLIWWSRGGWQHPKGLSQKGTCLEEGPLSEFPSYMTRGPQEPMSYELPEPRTSQYQHLPLPLPPWLHRQILPRWEAPRVPDHHSPREPSKGSLGPALIQTASMGRGGGQWQSQMHIHACVVCPGAALHSLSRFRGSQGC